MKDYEQVIEVKEIVTVEVIGKKKFDQEVNALLLLGFFLIGFPTVFHNSGNTKYIQVLGRS